jgi:tetratricopeptide (TPR) repeat protein
VYATIDETARRGLHRRVARTLDQLFPERPSLGATIARHFDAAGFADDALARYVPAVRFALDVFAQGEAVALASRALELCSHAGDRFALHRLREEGAARAGDVTTRRLDCTAMIEVAQELADEELLGDALSRMIAFCRHRSASDDQAIFIAQLRALSDRTASPRWALAAALASADLHISRSNFRAAEAALLEAEPLVGPVAGDTLGFEYWYMRAFVGAWIDPHQARAALGFAQSRVAGDRMRTSRALRVEALIAEVEGDARTLRRVAAQLLELCVTTGDIEGQATAHRNLANAAWALFDVAADRVHTSEALHLFERVQKPQAIAAVILHRGVCAQQFGDFAAADADYAEAQSIWESLGQFGNACTALSNRSFLASFRGDPASARDLAIEALELAHERGLEREGIYSLEALGVAERDLKMFAEARLHLEAALDWRRERDPRTMLEGLIEIVPVYLALGEFGAARSAAGALLEGIDRDRSLVPFPVHALSVAAAAYAASGESERASALRSEAEALLRELAERIDEGPSRAGYLSLPVHRAAAEGGARS